jgi:apolipoprotein N-acyltransferase
MTASFPPINAYFLAYISLIPLLFALRNSTFLSAFLSGFMTGFIHEIILLSWMIPTLTTHAQFSVVYAVSLTMIMSVILAINIAVFASLTHFFSPKTHQLLILPLFWVSLEWIKSWGQLAFPWELMGYSQYKCTTLIQFSDIAGVYGVSGFIVLMNSCIFMIILFFSQITWNNQKITKPLMTISAVLILCIPLFIFMYGLKQIHTMDKKISKALHKTVMIVQPSIPQNEKWDGDNRIPITKKMISQTYEAKQDTVDLVVWPETSLPYAIHSKHQLRQFVLQSIKQMNIALVAGSPTFIKDKQKTIHYNSAYVINKQGQIKSRYDKVRLVPFSEHLPFSCLRDFWIHFGAPDDKFSSGIAGQVHSLEDLTLGIQICFEIIFPEYTRMSCANGANLIINISNDAWFGHTASPYQHFSMAVFRAVENKRALVRCANSGISGIIDPCGRILSQSQLFDTTTIIDNIPIIQDFKSIYSKWGDWFAVGSVLISLLWGFWALAKQHFPNFSPII